MSWYLRINPSSGNLHATEAYAVLPALEWLPGGAGGLLTEVGLKRHHKTPEPLKLSRTAPKR
jgi:hypothetical protein